MTTLLKMIGNNRLVKSSPVTAIHCTSSNGKKPDDSLFESLHKMDPHALAYKLMIDEYNSSYAHLQVENLHKKKAVEEGRLTTQIQLPIDFTIGLVLSPISMAMTISSFVVHEPFTFLFGIIGSVGGFEYLRSGLSRNQTRNRIDQIDQCIKVLDK